MKNVQSLELKNDSREEMLPGFAGDFPYIASCARLDNYIGGLVPWHWHPAVELFYMQSGCLEYSTPKGTWVFPAGSGGFVNSNVLHTSRIVQLGEPNIQLLHLFDQSLIGGEHGSRMEKKYILPIISRANIEIIPLMPHEANNKEILSLIRGAFELSEEEWGYEIKLREQMSRIWMMLTEMASWEKGEPCGEDASGGLIKEMMIYIHENYGQKITVEELAEKAHISKRACHRLFRETLHTTPVEYITAYRMQEACRMLAKTDMSITDVAAECGLGASSYFGRLFKEKYRCTPVEYRKRWQDSDSFRRL